jgi:hypothetical protein
MKSPNSAFVLCPREQFWLNKVLYVKTDNKQIFCCPVPNGVGAGLPVVRYKAIVDSRELKALGCAGL